MTTKILFVCTGNMCRSPMAQILFQNLIAKEPWLGSAGIEVDSAGTRVSRGGASPDAVQVMREHGLDLSSFRSKPVEGKLVEWADLILAMEADHAREIVARYPEARTKTSLLSVYAGEDGGVPDPIGCGIEAYRQCAASLKSLVGKVADKLKYSH